MKFISRWDAGLRLGGHLKEKGIRADLILGLPRGGVVVAAAIARAMNLPLDTLVVRKIGHPLQREFAVGALAEPDVVVLDEISWFEIPMSQSGLNEVVAEEMTRLREYRSRFHRAWAPSLNGKCV